MFIVEMISTMLVKVVGPLYQMSAFSLLYLPLLRTMLGYFKVSDESLAIFP